MMAPKWEKPAITVDNVLKKYKKSQYLKHFTIIFIFLHFVISNSCLACCKENSAFVEITTLDIQQVRLRLGECYFF